MLRRSFLKGAAALAAAPALPVSGQPATLAMPPIAGPRYRNCVVISRSGTRIFAADGKLRVTIGDLNADWETEPCRVFPMAS